MGSPNSSVVPLAPKAIEESMDLNLMMNSFRDELTKIKLAGSLQGHVRSGRRPLTVDRMLEKESELPKVSDIVKTGSGLPNVKGRDLALLAGGAGLYHQGRKVKRRYDLGRQVEMSQVQ